MSIDLFHVSVSKTDEHFLLYHHKIVDPTIPFSYDRKNGPIVIAIHLLWNLSKIVSRKQFHLLNTDRFLIS